MIFDCDNLDTVISHWRCYFTEWSDPPANTIDFFLPKMYVKFVYSVKSKRTAKGYWKEPKWAFWLYPLSSPHFAVVFSYRSLYINQVQLFLNKAKLYSCSFKSKLYSDNTFPRHLQKWLQEQWCYQNCFYCWFFLRPTIFIFFSWSFNTFRIKLTSTY